MKEQCSLRRGAKFEGFRAKCGEKKKIGLSPRKMKDKLSWTETRWEEVIY